MEIIEHAITIPTPESGRDILENFRAGLNFELEQNEIPVRFIVTNTDDHHYSCEIGVVRHDFGKRNTDFCGDLFSFRQRKIENTKQFNAVLLIPTGIGAEIGGHAGDSTAAAKVLAELCGTLVVHPNIVNASDINEMPANSLYVEGSVIARMLMGNAGLQPIRSNRVLVVLDDHKDKHFVDLAINSVSAARAIYGLNCPEIITLDPPIIMEADYSESGRAVGRVRNLDHCLGVLEDIRDDFDAIAFSSVIRVPFDYHLGYFQSEGAMINPWGGVEAMLTHAMSSIFDVPTAHSPMFENQKVENLEAGVVDPRMSAEAVSVSFLQCILKGLHKSPKIITNEAEIIRPEVFSVEDVSCLVIPDGCLGIPTIAALKQGITVIAVRENANLMKNDLSRLPWRNDQFFVVDNYLEAAGLMAALKAGVTLESVRRPLSWTPVRSAQESTDHAAVKIK